MPHARVLVLLLGLTALCCAYGEGAIADWTTLHLTDDVHASAGTAAAGYAAYAFAMTSGRVGGTWLSIRLGQTRVMVVGGLTAAAGMLLAALAPSAPLALTGFVLVGLGLANIFPLAIARAGAAGGPQGVALASTLGYGGMLIGPPVIGFLADAVGLPLALTTVALAAVLAALLPSPPAGGDDPRPPVEAPRSASPVRPPHRRPSGSAGSRWSCSAAPPDAVAGCRHDDERADPGTAGG